MFVELMPVLAGRTVMITVARVDERTLRVHVIPTTTCDTDNAALTTPLGYTGTPEELDRELGQQLAGYVEAHQQLGSTLAQAKAEMDAAAKAAREEAEKKAAERKKKTAEMQAERHGEKPASVTSVSAAEPASSMSLFETSQPPRESDGGVNKTKTAVSDVGIT